MNRNTYICNPITREYIKIPPIWSAFSEYESFGLGVSKLTGQYKVVRWFEDYAVNSSTKAYAPWKCGVYTLETGLWRTIVAVSAHAYWLCGKVSVFLNGNLHLLVSEEKLGVPREIACFDLETESFSTFFVPDHPTDCRRTLCALGDCLCMCDTSRGCVDIWLMSKYGDDKSWTKEFAIRTKLAHGKDLVPIKILSEQGSRRLHCYSSKCKTTTIRHIDLTGSFDRSRMEPAVYAPSFLPLKNFAHSETNMSIAS
ncbi:F-box protein CPR1-like isoform X2 [Salvia miltiorrhiza]|nr:F-box protein CPR1-like isoform X2 [Salvia miltiorrhiza]